MKQETAAYKASCSEAAERQWITSAELDAFIAKCVIDGVNDISCKGNPSDPTKNPCVMDLLMVFRERGRSHDRFTVTACCVICRATLAREDTQWPAQSLGGDF